MRAAKEPVEQIAVCPFEIEDVENSIAHTPVAEERPARIHDETCSGGRRALVVLLQYDIARCDRGKVIARRPAHRVGFYAEIGKPLLEGFESCIVVAVI